MDYTIAFPFMHFPKGVKQMKTFRIAAQDKIHIQGINEASRSSNGNNNTAPCRHQAIQTS
jgi:hypothetical protein